MDSATRVGLEAALGLWTAVTLFVVVNRTRYDRREGRRDALARTLVGEGLAQLPPHERHAGIDAVLAPLSRRAVYRSIADERTPAAVATMYAAYARRRWGADAMAADASRTRRGRKWRRVSAISALGRTGAPGAHELLGKALRDADVDVSGAAMVALRFLGDRAAAACLVSALEDPALQSSRVAMQLDRFEIPIADLLRPLLRNADPRPRRWAASLLRGCATAPWVAPELMCLARDGDPQVRKAALATLADGGVSVAHEMSRALHDEVPYVRSTAVRGLGFVATTVPPERRAPFASWIAHCLGDDNWDVRLTAREALAQLGPSVRQQVSTFLDSDDQFARDGAAEVLHNLDAFQLPARTAVPGASTP